MNTQPDVLDEKVLAELSERGMAIYEQRLKAVLEPEHDGEIVAVHLDTGEYAVAANSPVARRLLRARIPDGIIMTVNIGTVPVDDALSLRMLRGASNPHPCGFFDEQPVYALRRP